jgi:hypothetical protein
VHRTFLPFIGYYTNSASTRKFNFYVCYYVVSYMADAVVTIGKNNVAPYTIRRNWLCCIRYRDRSNFQSILPHLELSPIEKEIIQRRYFDMVENFQWRAQKYSCMFFIGHFIITVGSLLVPALKDQ